MHPRSLPGTVSVTVPTRRPSRLAPPGERTMLVVVALAAIAVPLITLLAGPSGDTTVLHGIPLLGCTACAGVVLAVLAGHRAAWVGTRWLAVGSLGVVALLATGLVTSSGGGANAGAAVTSAGMGLTLTVLLVMVVIELTEHVKSERLEICSDIALVATVVGVGVFLLLPLNRPDVSPSALAAGMALAGGAVLVLSAWAVLALWCPTRIHLGLFACVALAAGAVVAFDRARLGGSTASVGAVPELAAGLAFLGLAAIMVLEPRLNSGEPRPSSAAQWVRPGLLVFSLVSVCAMLVVALTSPGVEITQAESVILSVVVFGAVTVRTILSHLETARSTKQREAALGEREDAIASLRSASDVISASEARLRLLLDSAVDGIVELDHLGTIVRANRAFCSLVRRAPEDLAGRSWVDLCREVDGGGSLVALPDTGEAVLHPESVPTYLEARLSALPTTPPGTLLLIRDVTGSKVSEQTIRTLFQFLQDRDEDRTRLLLRTNTAIEAERNRISRDLHDGPVQGVAAATLSVQAARMLIETRDVKGARELLAKIGAELEDETGNLRRLMGDLRPPVLDERGLIPAVRELCGRFEQDTQVPVTIVADQAARVPSDVETLAYRVVQEALTNVSKHAKASQVHVRVDAGGGTLRVQVSDDGRGFEPKEAREFLRKGRVGLASMRERAELGGGTFTVKSTPGKGTTVAATLPFEVLDSAPHRT